MSAVRHLADLSIPGLVEGLVGCGVGRPFARTVAVRIHQRGVREWEGLGLGCAKLARVRARFRFGRQLETVRVLDAADKARKFVLVLADGARIETVRIPNRTGTTACISSQAGCALGCAFCATGRIGLGRHLTAGEMTGQVLEAGPRVSDVVFMGQGEPLHNYDAVMDACGNLAHALGPHFSRRRITVSTSGLVPEIRRYAREGRPWRLFFSLHSAVQETRARLMPIAIRHPLPELVDAIREYQERSGARWVTLQYVALPGVNMDDRHVDALGTELRGLRYILNVIPWNDAGGGFRAPDWAEVKDFTTRLRRLACPVKIRYSAGKQAGMGCGQLSSGRVAVTAREGHLLAPPGIFTG